MNFFLRVSDITIRQSTSEYCNYAAVQALANEVIEVYEHWSDDSNLPNRAIHGDLKFNNILFAGTAGSKMNTAAAIIDFDTVGRMPLYMELGDAWRSWCNRAGEDSSEAAFDLELFRASVEGYFSQSDLTLSEAELDSLGSSIERISLELTARFAADALNENYFGWNPEKYPSSSAHNLIRAQGQWSLHHQCLACLDQRREILAKASTTTQL